VKRFRAAQVGTTAAYPSLLRVSSINPRYFTDDSGRAIYLTGSHTWAGLIDRGPLDPPAPFNFERTWICFKTPITISFDFGAVT
jgi:hypothetical protein